MKYLLSLTGACILFCATASAEETRCGWYDNPSPGNIFLTDHTGTWTITSQGGAEGGVTSDIPDIEFNDNQWVADVAGSYGHGCACLRGKFNHKTLEAISLSSGTVRALSTCRKDKALKEPE